MEHNSVVSGHLKFTGISWVDGLLTGPPDLGCHNIFLYVHIIIYFVYILHLFL